MTLTNCRSEVGRAMAKGPLPSVVLDAGALTQTPLALHDAVKGAGAPLLECRTWNVDAREEFRRRSWPPPAARDVPACPAFRVCALVMAGCVLLTEKQG
jgi:3-dehydroquinate dehydratase-2